MKKSTIFYIVLAILLGTIISLYHRAAAFASGISEQGVTIEYAKGSITNGQAYIALQTEWQPVWLNLEWQWCPGANPLRWCVEFDGDTAEGKAKIGTNGSKFYISDLMATTQSVELVFAGFVTTQTVIEANVKEATLSQAKDLSAIETLDATIMLSDIDAMGFRFDNHRIIAQRKPEQRFTLDVSGEQANGIASSTVEGNYTAQFDLTPDANIASMISGALPKNADGSLRYEASGKLPVSL